jgi:hypothetical protein
MVQTGLEGTFGVRWLWGVVDVDVECNRCGCVAGAPVRCASPAPFDSGDLFWH